MPEEKCTWWRLDTGWRSVRNALLLMLLIAGCDAAGVLIARFLPAVQAAREAARQHNCAENLKQIGLAMQQYHEKYGCFPPAFIPDKRGKPMHSWRVLLLPFLGRKDLYDAYRFDQPWDGPENRGLVDFMPQVYRCPTDSDAGPSRTSYAMIVGPHAISNGPHARRRSDIKNDPAETIMVAEATGAGIRWIEPRDLDAEKLVQQKGATAGNEQRQVGLISSCHANKGNVLYCDGTVQALSGESLGPNALKAIMTIDGGEPILAE